MTPTNEPEPLLSVPKVAALFDVKPETIREWIKKGSLKATKINGYWRVAQSEVVRYGNAKFGG